MIAFEFDQCSQCCFVQVNIIGIECFKQCINATCIPDHSQRACRLSSQWIATGRCDLSFILKALNQLIYCFDGSMFAQPPDAVVPNTWVVMIQGFKR